MRYCTILKDHSIQIVDASKTKNMANLWELESYFQGIIWSADKLNLTYIKEFNSLVFRHFGPEVFREMQTFNKVDKELRKCFASIEPTPNEIKDYLEKFCKRYDIDGFEFGEGYSSKKNDSGNNNNNGGGGINEFDDMINGLKSNPTINQQESDFKIKEDSEIKEESEAKPMSKYGIKELSEFGEPAEEEEKEDKSDVKPADNFDYPEISEHKEPSEKHSHHKNPSQKQNTDYKQPFIEESQAQKEEITDDYMKKVIESNIEKSYFKVKKSEKKEKKEADEDDIDALISNLKDLGVTDKNYTQSKINYDAQRHYKNKGEGGNDYNLDFGSDGENK